MNSKAHKTKPSKKSPGTVLAAQMRAESNRLTDSEREKLQEEFMKVYYGGKSKRLPARRR